MDGNKSYILYGSSSGHITKPSKVIFSGTATELCEYILKQSCDYCKLTYNDNGIVYTFYSLNDKTHKYPMYHSKESLLDYIFLEFIKKNTNTKAVLPIISEYLNKLKP